MKRKGQLKNYVIEYYRNASNSINHEVNEEEKELQLVRLFKQVEEEGRVVVQNQTVSGLLEQLLPLASWKCCSRLLSCMSGGGGGWAEVCVDRFAHRVLQTVVHRVQRLLFDAATPKGEKWRERVLGQLRSLCSHVQLSYSEYLEHPCGTHVLRTYLQLVSGVSLPRTPFSGRHDTLSEHDATLVPALMSEEDYRTVLIDFANRFLLTKHVKTFLESQTMSPFLQVLLLTLKLRLGADFRAVCKHLLQQADLYSATEAVQLTHNDEEVHLPNLLSQPCASFFFEQLLTLMSKKHRQLFLTVVSQQQEEAAVCCAMCVTPRVSFVLRSLVQAVDSVEEASQLLERLSPVLPQALKEGQHGVLVALAERLLPLEGAEQVQQALCERLVALFSGGAKREESRRNAERRLVLSVLRLRSWSKKDPVMTEEEAVEVTLPGSLLLQALLSTAPGMRLFGMSSLVKLPAQCLLKLSCNAAGSRVLDVYFRSSAVDAANKMLLLRRLGRADKQGAVLLRMSCDRHGSRVVEGALASLCGTEQHAELVQLLLSWQTRLSSDQFGRHVAGKCRVAQPPHPHHNNKRPNSNSNSGKLQQNRHRGKKRKLDENA